MHEVSWANSLQHLRDAVVQRVVLGSAAVGRYVGDVGLPQREARREQPATKDGV
eukprot:SAG22_NODE_2754_length_2245_cov_2.641659_2_plen_54_part_00